MYLPAAQVVQGAVPFACPENPALHWHPAPGCSADCSEFAGHGVHAVDRASHVHKADASLEVVPAGQVVHTAIVADLCVLAGHGTHCAFTYTYPALHVQASELPAGESEFATHTTHDSPPPEPS